MDNRTYHDHLADIPMICSWLDIEDAVGNDLTEYFPDLDIETATKRVVSDLFLTSTIAIFTDRDNDTIRSSVKMILFEIANVVPTSEAIRYHYFAIYSKSDLNNQREEDTLVPRLNPLVSNLSGSDPFTRENTLKQLLEKTGDYVYDNLQIISIRKPTEMNTWNEFLTIVSKNTAYGIMYLPGVLVSDDDEDFTARFYIQERNPDFPGYVAQHLTDNFHEKFILNDVYDAFTEVVKESMTDEYLQQSLMSLQEQVTTGPTIVPADIPVVEEEIVSAIPKWKQIKEDTCIVVSNSEDNYLRYHFTKIIDIFEETRNKSTTSDDSIVEDFYLSVYRAFSRVSSVKPTCTDCKCGDKDTLVSSTLESAISTTKDISVHKDNKEIHIHIHL